MAAKKYHDPAERVMLFLERDEDLRRKIADIESDPDFIAVLEMSDKEISNRLKEIGINYSDPNDKTLGMIGLGNPKNYDIGHLDNKNSSAIPSLISKICNITSIFKIQKFVAVSCIVFCVFAFLICYNSVNTYRKYNVEKGGPIELTLLIGNEKVEEKIMLEIYKNNNYQAFLKKWIEENTGKSLNEQYADLIEDKVLKKISYLSSEDFKSCIDDYKDASEAIAISSKEEIGINKEESKKSKNNKVSETIHYKIEVKYPKVPCKKRRSFLSKNNEKAQY